MVDNRISVSVSGKAVQGVAWNLATQVIARTVGMVSTLLITRFITPDQLGEVNAAAIFVQSASLLTTVGFGQYVIAKRASPEATWTAFALHCILGAIGWSVVVALSPILGDWVEAPEMGRFMPWLVLAFVFERFAYMPERILARGLNFRVIAVTNAGGEIAYAVVALVVAAEHGGWGVVAGNIARQALKMVVYVSIAPRSEWLVPVKLKMETVREILRFGLPVSVGIFTEVAASRIDKLIVSGVHGPARMAHYNMSYNLAEAPLDAMGEQLASVLLPSFSRLEPEQRPRALVRTLALMTLLTAPFGVGLGAVAPTLVDVVLPDKWQGVAPLLAILSVLSVIKPILWCLNSFGYSNQQPRLVAAMGLLKLALLTVGVATLGRISILWVCWSVGIVAGVHIIIYMLAVERSGGPTMKVMIGSCLPPLLACVPMLVVVWYLRPILGNAGVSDMATLIVQLAVGSVLYIVGGLTIARAASKDFINLVKTKLLKRGGADD